MGEQIEKRRMLRILGGEGRDHVARPGRHPGKGKPPCLVGAHAAALRERCDHFALGVAGNVLHGDRLVGAEDRAAEPPDPKGDADQDEQNGDRDDVPGAGFHG